MVWSVTSLALAAVGAITLLVAVATWRYARQDTRRSLTVLLIAAGVWNLTSAVEVAAGSQSLATFAGGVPKFAAASLVPAAVLVFTLRLTSRTAWLRPRFLAALAIEPLWVITMVALPWTRGLVRESWEPLAATGARSLAAGPLFWVHFWYVQLLLLAASILLVGSLIQARRSMQPGGPLVLVGITVPILAYFACVLAQIPVDAAAIVFAAGACLLVWAAERHSLFSVPPVARELVVDRMSEAVLVLDSNYAVADLNPAAERITGTRREQALGIAAGELLRATPEVRALLEAVETEPVRAELRLFTVDREAPYFEAVASPLPSSAGYPASYILVLRDITERKRLDAQLERLAHFDSLTGLPNRKLFMDRLAQALARARRDGRPLAVLFCDLDGFKRINDSLGHERGDAVLQELAKRLASRVRDGDTVARFGGDEYTVILSQLTHAEDAAFVARKLLTTVSEPMQLAGKAAQVTASMGIAVWPRDGDDRSTLVRCADMAMYRAKARGPDHLAFFTPEIGDSAATRMQLEEDLRVAIRGEQLELMYQPQVALLDDGPIVGLEALARWQHQELGTIPPGTFIPMAEELGLMRELGSWVLREACLQAAHWQQLLHRPVSVAVNVSHRQLSGSLINSMDSALDLALLNPARLTVELSERTIGGHGEHAIELITAVRTRGVRVALDDFGTGKTSLTELADLPLDILKIDRSLVSALSHRPDPKAQAVLGATIRLAHQLQLQVIGEGVEQRVQRDQLGKLGCDAAQGHLFSKAQPAAEVPDLLLHQ